MITRQYGTLYEPHDDNDDDSVQEDVENDIDGEDVENAGVVNEDAENAGVDGNHDTDDNEAFEDIMENIPIDDVVPEGIAPDLLMMVEAQITDEDQLLTEAMHVDVADETELPDTPNTNIDATTTKNIPDGDAPRLSERVTKKNKGLQTQ